MRKVIFILVFTAALIGCSRVMLNEAITDAHPETDEEEQMIEALLAENPEMEFEFIRLAEEAEAEFASLPPIEIEVQP